MKRYIQIDKYVICIYLVAFTPTTINLGLEISIKLLGVMNIYYRTYRKIAHKKRLHKLIGLLSMILGVSIVFIGIAIPNIYNRYKIINRARDMANLKWKAPMDIPMWNSKDKFKKGSTYKGIPYTQSINQIRDSKEFTYDIKIKNDFLYKKYDVTGPNYGNDCSGFISAVWDIPRCTTHDIEKYAKEISYEKLKMGDALLTDEHIMLFIKWNDKNHTKLTVYEQTPPMVRNYTYSLSYLQSNKYKPIRLKKK